MASQDKSVHKKRLGRPPGIKFGGTIPARFEISTMEALDAWAGKHKVSRSEAIRRLVEIGLKATPKIRPVERALAHAAELAAKALNEHTPRRRRRAKD